jgi:hypothetical protein
MDPADGVADELGGGGEAQLFFEVASVDGAVLWLW